MMLRLVRFLIVALTLGRIKWLMRLTWVWRFVVFLGVTGWLSRKARKAIGLDKSAKTDVDSAWAEALRYTPTSAAAGVAYTAPAAAAAPVTESRSEVTGVTADGAEETVTIHDVSVEGETETIVEIADSAGNVEAIVTSSPVEELDLADLGTPAQAETQSIEEIVVAEIESEAAIDEILDTLEAAEPGDKEDLAVEVVESAEVAEVKPKKSRARRTPEPEPAIDPDWVRGDGSHNCPASHPVKAKANSMIYYVPESGHYDRTIPDVCFASEIDAEASGYRAPRR
ncbi:MAG: hypothetical protein E6R14_07345 [Thermomicrobiales bacterium]|nr:MAG: hypothetical protein E6R14_07345 [Thermomicrobiales bacterium]